MKNTDRFIDSINVENTKKVVKHVFMGTTSDIDMYKKTELEQLILNMHPASPKDITTAIYVFSLYAKWLQQETGSCDLLSEVRSLDKNAMWKRAKPNAKKKYISNSVFSQTVHEIARTEEYNPLYYVTLLRAIYEGVYNDDMSVLVNLRTSDISGNVLTLREDNGHIYKLKVSKELAENMLRLAGVDTWLRPNRHGICRVSMDCTCPDRIFKVEYRKSKKAETENTYRFSYYNRLRKISDQYFGYRILPLPLYISGIMHRIRVELGRNGITLNEAFSDNSRNRLAHNIISKELTRCNYTPDIGNFREMVKGHLESFV